MRVSVFRATRPQQDLIARLIRRVARAERVAACELSIVLVSNPEIKRLNRRFLKHNRFTDVISFPMKKSRTSFESGVSRIRNSELPSQNEGERRRAKGEVRDFSLLPSPSSLTSLLGEIYISRDQARIQSRRYHVPFHEELQRLALHGFLHLLGYTHRQMLPLECKYLESLRTPHSTLRTTPCLPPS